MKASFCISSKFQKEVVASFHQDASCMFVKVSDQAMIVKPCDQAEKGL